MSTRTTGRALGAEQAGAVDRLIAYHDLTKHHPGRFARGPGGLDWANQPDPFRRFAGAPVYQLPLAVGDESGDAGILFGVGSRSPQPFTLEALGWFLELSMGLSARKEIPGSSWFLRMNPSSGNLHPTEAYAILPTLENLPGGAGVYHYAPRPHALEQRARWPASAEPAASGFWVGLSSVTWREAWKYGERAFRYCQHDVGHALGALRFAAAALGWQVRWEPGVEDTRLAQSLGLDRGEDFNGAERETPEILVGISRDGAAALARPPASDAAVEWFGKANRLSATHLHWPAIDEAIAASERTAVGPGTSGPAERFSWPPPVPPLCGLSAGQIIRQRRSAVNFDAVTCISRETLLAILDTTLPRAGAPPFDFWPHPPRVHLVLFVHRVSGLEPGLYLWLRAPGDAGALQDALKGNLDWPSPAHSDPTAPLRRLGKGDLRDFAQDVSCGQAIAADSAFSLGMLARFEPVLREQGPAAYRELFWETGLIGQALYLAAEAAGVRGTGIGCYFDDVLHRGLGLAGHEWQSLYHFTIGGPIEDHRLRTMPPYAHPPQHDDRCGTT